MYDISDVKDIRLGPTFPQSLKLPEHMAPFECLNNAVRSRFQRGNEVVRSKVQRGSELHTVSFQSAFEHQLKRKRAERIRKLLHAARHGDLDECKR